MVKIFFSKNCQVKAIISKAIVTSMPLKHGTKIEFIFYGKTLVMNLA
ncbi:MAG: hypothetical protein AABW41_01900 [Nanoarchaeota archaeon]